MKALGEFVDLRLAVAVAMTLLAVGGFAYSYFDYQTVVRSCTSINVNDLNACAASQKYFLGGVVGGMFAGIIALVGWAMVRADSR